MYARISITVTIQENDSGQYWNRKDLADSSTEFQLPVEVAGAVDYSTIVHQVILDAKTKALAEKQNEEPDKAK